MQIFVSQHKFRPISLRMCQRPLHGWMPMKRRLSVMGPESDYNLHALGDALSSLPTSIAGNTR